MALSNSHIANINRVLTNIKLDIRADYACLNQNSTVIVTNKIASLLNLQIIENFVKNIKYINSDNIKIPCFS